jgi:hypothetical protein
MEKCLGGREGIVPVYGFHVTCNIAIMPPEKNIRLGLLWTFRLVDGPAGAWWFRWESFDTAGNKEAESARAFETLSECIADAREHGYVEPEQRDA